MQRHLPKLALAALAAAALLALGGCAIEPSYHYNANGGAGYYTGESSYGNADTVIYGSAYVNPWGWGVGWAPGWGWGPAWSVGAGWWGYGNIGLGVGYTWHPHRHWHRHQHWRGHRRHARRALPPARVRAPRAGHGHHAPVHPRAPSGRRSHGTH